jgi:hypothetical protein
VPTLGLAGSALPTATAGDAYSAQLTTTGGAGTDAWSVASGSLPAGISLNATTGVISGTPTAEGDSSFTIGVANAGPPTQSASASFSLTVAAPPPGKPAIGKLRLKGHKLEIALSCAGTTAQVCKGTVSLTVVERFRGSKLVALAASAKTRLRSNTVTLGKVSFDTQGMSSKTATIALNALGRRLLRKYHRLTARVTVKLAGSKRNALTKTVRLT